MFSNAAMSITGVRSMDLTAANSRLEVIIGRAPVSNPSRVAATGSH